MSQDDVLITVKAEEVVVSVEEPGDTEVIVDPDYDLFVIASSNFGPQGPQGPVGPSGPKGDQGIQGNIGPQGPQGVEGPLGPPGPQGATGTGITMQGSVALPGDLPSDAQQGDAYLVEEDDSLWIFDGEQWVDGGSIQGPPGPIGPQGQQGPMGPQGIEGIQGTPGEDGLGVPPGGAVGEILTKLSPADNDSDWLPPAPSGADLNYLGDYVPETPYDDGDIVVYQGMPWMAVKPTTTPPDPWPGSPLDLSPYQLRSEEGQADGYASLDGSGKVPLAQLPPISGGAELTYEGDYAAETQYQDGDVVVKDGIVFMCVGGPTTVPPDIAPWGVAGIFRAPTYGTSFPTAPFDGQEHVLVDSLSTPTYQWRFRYNALSSSPYKWEFVGGSALTGYVDVQETLASASYTSLPTPGPTIAIPRAGEYEMRLGCKFDHTVAAILYMSYDVGATGALDSDSLTGAISAPSQGRDMTRIVPRTFAATATLTAKYKVTTGTGYFARRSLSVLPVRVS